MAEAAQAVRRHRRFQARLDIVADWRGRRTRESHRSPGHRHAEHAPADEASTGNVRPTQRTDSRLRRTQTRAGARYAGSAKTMEDDRPVFLSRTPEQAEV